MDNDILSLTLAGLLHDIGKPMQRAVKGDSSKLSAKAAGMATLVGRGDRSYAHCLWTSEFFQDPNVRRVIQAAGINPNTLESVAARHHNPDAGDVMQQIITLADRASAGTDRDHAPDDEPSADTGTGMRYYQRPLESIFSRIVIDNRERSKPCFYPAESLSDPLCLVPSPECRPIEYGPLVKSFIEEFSRIGAKDNTSILVDTIASLLVHWFSCVPSSTMEEHADIPLSDHLLTTASIAAALGLSWKETGTAPTAATKLLLVGGDLSGIQDFIFTMSGESNRQIAKLIRGKSFMVSMYCQLAARMITDICGLPPLCCLSTAGGRFSVLLPDTAKAREGLANATGTIAKWAHREFFGDLRILIDDGEPFALGDFAKERFQKVLDRSAARTAGCKLAGNLQGITHNVENWIDNRRWPEYQKTGTCPICGREPAAGAGTRKPGRNCGLFIEYGTCLTKENIVHITADKDGVFGRYSIGFGNPGDMRLLEACWCINQQTTTAPDALVLPALHYANVVPKKEPSEHAGNGTDDNLRCTTFEEMAGDGVGLGALAVFKADVDNMGHIFAQGFGGALSLSRQVALSRMLNWFFAGYLPAMLNADNQNRTIYTVFAGGDDLCLFGHWERMTQLAIDIRTAFNAFTCANPSITISAGLTLFKPGYPVARAVAAATEALDKAKDDGRNKITAFDLPMFWDAQYQTQLTFANEWRTLLGNNAQKSEEENQRRKWGTMLYRFLRYWKEYQTVPEGAMAKLSHRFRFIYDIRRNLPRAKQGQKWMGELEPLRSLQADLAGHKGFEERPLFKFLKVGIAIAMYRERTNKTRT